MRRVNIPLGDGARGDGADATLVCPVVGFVLAIGFGGAGLAGGVLAAVDLAGVGLGAAGAVTGGGGGVAALRGALATEVCFGRLGTAGGATTRSVFARGGGANAAGAFGFEAGGGFAAGEALTAGVVFVAGGALTKGFGAAGAGSAAGAGLVSAAVRVAAVPVGPTSAASEVAGIRVPNRGLGAVTGTVIDFSARFLGADEDCFAGRGCWVERASIDAVNELISTSGGRSPGRNPRSPWRVRNERDTVPVGAKPAPIFTSTGGRPLPPITIVS